MTLQRRQSAIALFEENKIDALLVSSLHNCRYLSGFTGSNASMLVYKNGEATLFTDPRYTVQASQQADCRVTIAKGPTIIAVLKEIGKKSPRRAGTLRIGFESDHLSVTQFEAIARNLPARVKLTPVSGMIERLRMVKDAGEIDILRRAAAGNSQALENALKRFQAGMTEQEFAAEIDYQNRKLGAEAPAFDTIVAAGPHSALPHAHPGKIGIEKGMLLIDMGAFHDGYASDMSRMVHVGSASGKYKKAYKAVLEAQLAAIDAVRPGAQAASVDRAARRVLKKHGLEKEFVHSTGHGLGLQIHEPPRLGRKDQTKLVAGMAITIEPGVYLEGWGGIRIEDAVLVTAQGCEILTPTTKELRTI